MGKGRWEEAKVRDASSRSLWLGTAARGEEKLDGLSPTKVLNEQHFYVDMFLLLH